MFVLIGGSILLWEAFGLEEIGGWQSMVETSRDSAMSLWRSFIQNILGRYSYWSLFWYLYG